MNNRVFVAAAKRTAIGSFNGSLANVPAPDFGAEVVKDILAETQFPPNEIDEVLSGTVLTAGVGQGPARQVALKAGLPETVPGCAVGMVCGSGLKAVMDGATAIMAGVDQACIAGGTENMSMAPYLIPSARQGLKMGNKEIIDHLTYDALTDAYDGIHMGITAENVAAQYGISRRDQDAFAYASQLKAIQAVDSGQFTAEIVPISVKQRREIVRFDADEYPNRKTNLEKLESLRPAFKQDGTVTAGNASGINDGAAYLLLVSEEMLTKHDLEPLAEIVAFDQGGVAPQVMGLGPVPAIGQALARAGLTLQDMEAIELNEAFAAQSLGVVHELSKLYGESVADILDRTNQKGGAIALGHPVGASGARIAVTLLHIMKENKAKYGLASLCIGGGMGVAVVFKNTNL